MKRAALDHPKMKILARRLGITLAHANGLMERLWHFTAKYCPRGDIGKYSNDEIANEAGWEDETGSFIAALTAPGGFVETHEQYRLVVHDWSEHADDAVHKFIKKKGLTFWDSVPAYSRNVATVEDVRVNSETPKVEIIREQSRSIANDPGLVENIRDQSRTIRENSRPIPDCSCLPEPVPEPVLSYAAQPLLGDFLSPAGPQSDVRPEWEICLEEVAEAIYLRHPVMRRNLSLVKVQERLTTIVRKRGPTKRKEALLEIERNHAAVCQSHDWRKENGKFAKALSNWLSAREGLYSVGPPVEAPPAEVYIDASWRPER